MGTNKVVRGIGVFLVMCAFFACIAAFCVSLGTFSRDVPPHPYVLPILFFVIIGTAGLGALFAGVED